MPKQYPRELRERAVRLVIEHAPSTRLSMRRSGRSRPSWASPRRRRCASWVRQAEVDSGQRPGVSSKESAEIRRLRAEVKELRRANDLRAASAFFAAKSDRPLMRS